MALKLLYLLLILSDEFVDNLLLDPSFHVELKVVSFPKSVVFKLTHLDLGALLHSHCFLAELQTVNSLFDLRASWGDTDDDARS